MTSTFYLGESAGARVLAYGDTSTQVGDDYQASVTTWDLIPMGEVGDVLFRSIDVTFVATAGYAVGVTPIVDGIAQTEQTFSGADVGQVQVQAFVATRGTRIAATVRTLSRTGDLQNLTIGCSFVPVRRTP